MGGARKNWTRAYKGVISTVFSVQSPVLVCFERSKDENACSTKQYIPSTPGRCLRLQSKTKSPGSRIAPGLFVVYQKGFEPPTF